MFFTSCHKSVVTEVSIIDSTANNVVDYSSVNKLFDAMRPSAQTYRVEAGTNAVVRGMYGTALKFYPNSFKDQAGNVVTSGIVNVTIYEYYGIGGQMIAGSSATAAGKLLDVKGQVFVSASCNGQQLNANKYSIGFKSNQPMRQHNALFVGKVLAKDSVVSWTETSGAVGTATEGTVLDSFNIVTVDSSGTKLDTMMIHTNYNRFDSCTSFGWISAANFFASGGNLTNMTVAPNDTMFKSTNTVVYLAFSDIRSSCYLNAYNNTTHQFSFNTGYEVPVGVRANLIAVSNIGGHYYFYIARNMTIANGMNLHINLQPSTLRNILDELQSL